MSVVYIYGIKVVFLWCLHAGPMIYQAFHPSSVSFETMLTHNTPSALLIAAAHSLFSVSGEYTKRTLFNKSYRELYVFKSSCGPLWSTHKEFRYLRRLACFHVTHEILWYLLDFQVNLSEEAGSDTCFHFRAAVPKHRLGSVQSQLDSADGNNRYAIVWRAVHYWCQSAIPCLACACCCTCLNALYTERGYVPKS